MVMATLLLSLGVFVVLRLLLATRRNNPSPYITSQKLSQQQHKQEAYKTVEREACCAIGGPGIRAFNFLLPERVDLTFVMHIIHFLFSNVGLKGDVEGEKSGYELVRGVLQSFFVPTPNTQHLDLDR